MSGDGAIRTHSVLESKRPIHKRGIEAATRCVLADQGYQHLTGQAVVTGRRAARETGPT